MTEAEQKEWQHEPKTERLTIALDVDDVLHPFNATLRQWCIDQGLANYPWEALVSFNLHEVWNCTEEEAMDRLDRFYASKAFKDSGPPPLMQAVTSILAERHRLIAISARPLFLRNFTKAWVFANYPQVKTCRVIGNGPNVRNSQSFTKATYCKLSNVAIIVEDAPYHAKDLLAAHIPVIMPRYPWNKDFTNTVAGGILYKVDGLADIPKAVEAVSRMRR
jgi:uncharacterized HAD superfamily protein